jgi:hypothetical protein
MRKSAIGYTVFVFKQNFALEDCYIGSQACWLEDQHTSDQILEVHTPRLFLLTVGTMNSCTTLKGLPMKKHTSPNYNTASPQRLFDASTAMFPDVYEWNPGIDDSFWIERHVRTTLEMAKGQVPVYAQACPRFKSTTHPNVNPGAGVMHLHTIEEFLHDQVHSALAAVWIDAQTDTEHRIAGIAMWDAYIFTNWQSSSYWNQFNDAERKALFNELDDYHRTAYEGMQACTVLLYLQTFALEVVIGSHDC